MNTARRTKDKGAAPLEDLWDAGEERSLSDPSLVIDVDGFEGPLDLLLHLARNQKVDLARISILKILAQKNECICGEIVDVLPLAQSTVSQHLKELKNAGLINGTVEGPRSCYCINWKAFEKFSSEFNLLFNKLKVNNEKACC